MYYSENDPKAAAWLRELIFEGQIAWGDVDERSIEDVKPSDLKGYAQCHFFAGIGGWSYALRLAGWPDDKPVWTGSCPCQPFSAAGKGKGFADERHLWPSWFHLIQQCAPAWIFGEQVASPAGLQWFDLVHDDLEGASYSAEAFDLCAAGVGAPHIRQRLYWVAVADGGNASAERLQRSRQYGQQPQDCGAGRLVDDDDDVGREQHAQRNGEAVARGEEGASWLDTGGRRELRLAHAAGERLEVLSVEQARGQRAAVERGGELGGAGISGSERDAGAVPRAQASAERGVRGQSDIAQSASAASGVADDMRSRLQRTESPNACRGGRRLADARATSPWLAVEWIACRDGKSRPVEPGLEPLVNGLPGRVGLLRGYGNAIVPQVAAAFIEATGLV